MNNQEVIKKVYLSPRTGFKSVLNTYKTIKELYPNSKITKKEIEEFIKHQATHQIHTHQKIDKNDFNQIKAQGYGYMQMDLVDMSNYKKYNEGYRYILILVDVKSRYSMMEKLKTKTAEEVYREFLKFEYYCQSVNNRIYAIYTDKGSEWKLIEKNKDKYHYKVFFKEPDTHRGSGIVDNKIKWYRELQEKYFTTKNTLNWIESFQLINNNMNDTINTTTKEKPVEIWEHKVQSQQEFREPPPQIKVGQLVRVRNINDKFTKTSTGLFSEKVYKVKELDGLGFYVDGLSRKLFLADVKLVKSPSGNSGGLREKNKKNNTIKRRLRNEGLY